MKKTTFERYALFIQKYIYKKKWDDLREVQVEACNAIMDTDKHVVIASGTASGKTEAAFFPILTLLENNHSESIGVIYIGPLKALINDQFTRLNELLEDENIPVWSWHGDIPQSHKRKALIISKGILQITPESLEALLMKHPNDACRLFSDLRFIVIDEIHAFMASDRGMQVICLISRLEKMTNCKPRRIGLSATLNNYQSVMDFLSSGTNKASIAVGINNKKRSISLCAESFIISQIDEEATAEITKRYYDFLYKQCHNKKCIIFTNTRTEAENIIKELKNIAKNKKEEDIFYVHHGSISAKLRKDAENALKNNKKPTVVAATLTLELGIDTGDLDLIIQIGAPFTCSSFVQRLGRSGRRTGKSRIMFLGLHEESAENPLKLLPWDLLRSIAVIQLYSEERWVEPFEQKKKPYSLLAHQTLSILMTFTELTPSQLAEKVLLLPAFKNIISADEYKMLLKYMIEKEYLQRMDNGGIIVGLKGEKICNYYSFYAVFQDEEEYKVLDYAGEIGRLNRCPFIGETFSLAGKSWVTVAIEAEKKCVYVDSAKNSKVANWIGNGGDVHTKIMQKIKKVLEEDTIYLYLQENAKKALCDAREIAKKSGILDYDVIKYNENSYYICPWSGTKDVKTIVQLLSIGLKKQLDIRTVSNEYFYLKFTTGLDISSFINSIKNINCNINDTTLITKDNQAPIADKYDYMVPEQLLKIAYLNNQLNVYSALKIIKNLKWKQKGD